MTIFDEYLDKIEEKNRKDLEAIFQWMEEEYPGLEKRLAWGHPTYTDHGTFIISFEAHKKDLGICPEAKGVGRFSQKLEERGLKYGKMTFKIPWDRDIDFGLLREIIDFNIEDKKDWDKFWR